MTLPSITTNRTVLRWLEKSDVDALFDIFSDAETVRYFGLSVMTNKIDAENLLNDIYRHFERGDLFQWGIALRSNNQIIGTGTLNHINHGSRRAEIGFALNRKLWKQGLMREAMQALLRHAFNVMNLRRIEADVDPRNLSSIRLLEKLGFVREGLLRERWLVGDEVQDTIFYGLLKREFVFGETRSEATKGFASIDSQDFGEKEKRN